MCDGLEVVERVMKKYRAVTLPGLPRFTGGAVGFIGYEFIHDVEPSVPRPPLDELSTPSMYFIIADQLLVFDRVAQTITVLVNTLIDEATSPAEAYESAVEEIERLLSLLEQPSKHHPVSVPNEVPSLPFASNQSREKFLANVQGSKKFITAGDIIQVVGSQRFSVETKASPVDVYRAAKTVICISGKVQEILKTGMPPETSSTIVYNGTNPAFFPSALGESKQHGPEILMIGNLIRSKGQELVLQAFERIRSSFPQLRCRVIGDGPDRARLESLTRDLGIGDRVRFLGQRMDVDQILAESQVGLLITNWEGFPLSILEAMRAGLPVLASSVGGIGEAIRDGEGGYLVPRGDVQLLRDRIEQLLATPDLRVRMGASARRRYEEEFTLDGSVAKTLAVYRDVLAAAKPSGLPATDFQSGEAV